MFSGIVEEFAEVVNVVKDQENLHLTLKCSFVDELKIDQSVSHNGGVSYSSEHSGRNIYRDSHERNHRAFQYRSAQSWRQGERGKKHDDERTSGRKIRRAHV